MLPTHLWSDILKQSPKNSLAYTHASQDTHLVLMSLHQQSFRKLIVSQSLQLCCPETHWTPINKTHGKINDRVNVGKFLAHLQHQHQLHISAHLAAQGNLAACRWLTPNTPDWCYVARFAIRGGHCDCAMWIINKHKREKEILPNLTVAKDIVMNSRPHSLTKSMSMCALLEKCMVPGMGEEIARAAIQYGNLDMLRFLKHRKLVTLTLTKDKTKLFLQCIADYLTWAAFYNWLHICRWLHKKYCQLFCSPPILRLSDNTKTAEESPFLPPKITGQSTIPDKVNYYWRKAFVASVHNGHLEVAQYLHATYQIPTSEVTRKHCQVLRASCGRLGPLWPWLDDQEKPVCKNWQMCRWLYETFACVLDRQQLAPDDPCRQNFVGFSISEFLTMVAPCIVRAGSAEGLEWLINTFYCEKPLVGQNNQSDIDQKAEIGQNNYLWNRCWSMFRDSTVLMCDAILTGNVSMCQQLLLKTCLILTRYPERWLNILKCVVQDGHLDMLRWVKKKLHDVDFVIYGESFSNIVAIFCSDPILLKTAKHGHLHILHWLAEENCLPLKNEVLFWKALGRAIRWGHLEMCHGLIHYFFPKDTFWNDVVDNKHDFFQTGLSLAIKYGHLKVCLWLKQHGIILTGMKCTQHYVHPKTIHTYQWALDTFGPQIFQIK